jgi:hypothetical protein
VTADPFPSAGQAFPQLESLFQRAIELDRSERGPFLARSCAGAPELGRHLKALLDAHEALESPSGDGGFLEALDEPRAAALLLDVPPEIEPGSLIGRYRVVRRLGKGGMGVVYLAVDPALDRPVAVKVLPDWLGGDTEASQRLLSEARAAAALDHAHVATIYEVGETGDGRTFMAMAYYPGETLRERLGGAPIPPGVAARIAGQLAEGLAAAHARGIVHRDVKPENVVFGPGDTVRILDFGVAQVAAASPGAVSPGTVSYMSPEQAAGGPVDAQSDLWSLGVVLYEMLAGCRPFQADSRDALLRQIRQQEPPPLREVAPDVPPDLTAVVRRCLEKDPVQRFASASELAAALAKAAGPPPPAGRVQRGLILASAATYLALAWGILAVTTHLATRFFLPAWARDGVVLLLLVGLPVVLATTVATRLGRARPGRAHRL